jgi:hypothetical protein
LIGGEHGHKTDQHDADRNGQKPDHLAAHTFHSRIKHRLGRLFVLIIALLIVLIS